MLHDAPVALLRRSQAGEPVVAPEMRAIVRRLQRDIAGEVRFGSLSRGLYSTDASNYREIPIGVVVPRTVDDVVAAMAICREEGLPVLPRGGGTSLAGQTTNVAVVFDFSKYLRRVIDVDQDAEIATVEPGTVLDDMRDRARDFGLDFGPDPATHDRCTVGGMLGNNSCGVHSVMAEFYGHGPRTEHQVQSLDVLTYDGLRLTVGKTSDDELEAIVRAGGRRGEIYEGMIRVRDRYAPLIRERFRDIPRWVSGYNLPALLPENGFDVGRALVGSEGTCVTILGAKLRLQRARPERILVVLGYPSVYEAADHVCEIRALRPVGCEAVDQELVDEMRESGTHARDIETLPAGCGWLLVELGATSRDEARDQVGDLLDAIGRKRSDASVCVLEDAAEQAKLWEVRESALGATAFTKRGANWPGWEDAAVDPTRLGSYLRRFRALLDEFGLDGALYGHFAQGCVHTRISFDLESDEGVANYRRFTDRAADLVIDHGGSLSGEHGDGRARGDLLGKLYGPELMGAFHELKALWDPAGRMNPGVAIEDRSRTEHLKLADYHPQPTDVYFAYPEDGGDFAHAAMRCVGVGKCRHHGGGVMCPSYMVTLEEEHSTRGRARLLFEMMQGDVIKSGWQSEEVKDALDLCLACKGCKADCPVDVDMATYKAEFLAHYHEHQARPRQAHTLGQIRRWSSLAAHLPRLANAASHAPVVGHLAKWIAGIHPERDLPRFATTTFRQAFARREPSAGQAGTVMLWPDTFNDHFHPEVLLAATDVLEALGYQVVIPARPLCCGRPLYDYGFLQQARETWEETLDGLGDAIVGRLPIVGMEPSCVAAFRDELPNLMPGDRRAQRVTAQVRTLAELLCDSGADLARFDALRGRKAIVQCHCHHHSVMGFDADRAIFEGIGLDASVLDSGCCGMAGAFGFERDHYEVSLAAGERVLLPAVREAEPDTLVLADGFSCREQIRQRAPRRVLTLSELLRDGLGGRGAP